MTATLQPATRVPVARVSQVGTRRHTSPYHRLVGALPILVSALNAIAFLAVRPDVNDLWAARARASAVTHGVGLTYWFSWFGGSTPGNYSVVTPYLCAYLGTEVVAAVAAVGVIVLVGLLVRGTRHPFAASCTATIAVAANLWSGRVPFLLGIAGAAAALLALRHGRRVLTAALTVVAILASPIAGAFLALGLAGTFLTTRTRAWRPIIAWSVGVAAVALVVLTVVFGAPGAEPFSAVYAAEVIGGLLVLRVMNPPDHIRTTIWVALLATVVLWAVPNGLGANVSRFVWFCLPVAVVALSPRRTRTLALLVAPLLALGAASTVVDLHNADEPMASPAYFAPLVTKVDALPAMRDYRLEVVDHGAHDGYHAGYTALLGHASLARGWETQEDTTLNDALYVSPLRAVTYKVWLDNNAVGYVAMPTAAVGNFPEHTLVHSGAATYLHPVWRDTRWTLYRVQNPTPIVAAPASVTDIAQSSMTLHLPCACATHVRVRWSKFLSATLHHGQHTARLLSATGVPITARVTDDGSGWTTITTPRAGSYVLTGSFAGLVHG